MPHVSVLQLALLALVGVLVGAINAVAGAGSLITFPTLIAFGLTPLNANITNCVGVAAGNVSAAIGFRDELRGQWPTLRGMLLVTALGSVAGAIILLTLPSKVFDFVAPLLVAIGSALTLLQPWLLKRVGAHHADHKPHGHGVAFQCFLFLIALYGGYFGSGIGLLFFATLSMWLSDRSVHQIDGMKSVLQALSNGCAGLLFCFTTHVYWPGAIVLAISGWFGGSLGARLARRIPAKPLRIAIGVGGLVAAALIAMHVA